MREPAGAAVLAQDLDAVFERDFEVLFPRLHAVHRHRGDDEVGLGQGLPAVGGGFDGEASIQGLVEALGKARHQVEGLGVGIHQHHCAISEGRLQHEVLYLGRPERDTASTDEDDFHRLHGLLRWSHLKMMRLKDSA